jgi:hypothetical protein
MKARYRHSPAWPDFVGLRRPRPAGAGRGVCWLPLVAHRLWSAKEASRKTPLPAGAGRGRRVAQTQSPEGRRRDAAGEGQYHLHNTNQPRVQQSMVKSQSNNEEANSHLPRRSGEVAGEAKRRRAGSVIQRTNYASLPANRGVASVNRNRENAFDSPEETVYLVC